MMIFCYSPCSSTGVFIYYGGGEFLMIVFNTYCPLIHFIMITLFYLSLVVVVPSFCGEGFVLILLFL